MNLRFSRHRGRAGQKGGEREHDGRLFHAVILTWARLLPLPWRRQQTTKDGVEKPARPCIVP